MKKLQKPKDNKTFVINGRRFTTFDEAKIYAYVELDSWISYTSFDGIFTYLETVPYKRQDQQ